MQWMSSFLRLSLSRYLRSRYRQGLGAGILLGLLFGLMLIWSPVAQAGIGAAPGSYAANHAVSQPFQDDPITALTAANDGPTKVGDVTNFTASVSGGTGISYTWDYGDGNTDNGITAQHTYTQSGVYTATVTAANSEGSEQAQTVVYVGDEIVEVSDNVFSPAEITVDEGDTVVWVLLEGLHSVTADDGSFEQPTGSNWPPFAYTFNTAGTYPYYCAVHGAPGGIGMAGTVTVNESSEPGPDVEKLFLPTIQK